MKTLRLTVLASVLAVLTGCPKDLCKGVTCGADQMCEATTGICVNTPIPLADACDRVAKAQCDKYERCGSLDSAEKATCVALISDNCGVERDVNAMLGTYDAAAAADCVASFTTSECADTRAPESCTLAFVGGRGQANAPCALSSNCQADAGLYCRLSNGCGTCTRFGSPGDFCAAAAPATRCQSGLYCYEPTNDGGTCVTPRPPGAVCSFSVLCQSDAGFCSPTPTDGGARYCQSFASVGDRCTSTTNCRGGLFCNTLPGDGGVSLCETQRAVGEPCPVTAACQTGNYCPITAPRTCTAQLADGQPCTTATACLTPYCNRDPFDVGPNAGPRLCGYLTSVDACLIDDDCGPGKHCKNLHIERPDAGAVAGSCASFDPDGGACANSETLSADSCANTAATCLDGTCVVTPPFSRTSGQSCDYRRQCGSGTHCDFADPYTFEGHCTTTVTALGERCLEDVACGPRNSCFGAFLFGIAGVCMPLAHRGQACDFNDGPDCARDLECGDNPDGGLDVLCVPYVGPGSSCDDAVGPYCYSSYCSPDAGVCSSRRPLGEACDYSEQCGSNRCRNPDGGLDDYTCLMACY